MKDCILLANTPLFLYFIIFMTFIPPWENIAEKKKCKISGKYFFVTDKDLEYYDKKSPIFTGKKYLLPSPTLSPEERKRRRLTWRNERKLYHRKCDKTGNSLITIYSPDKPYKVYDQKVWWGDDWNPLDSGSQFDFNRSFFEQLGELHHRVPQINVITSQNENCEFTNLTANCRNCYLIYESSNNEYCEYGCWFQKSEHCLDCSFIHECKYCYEISDSYNCHSLFWSQNCDNCRESYYLSNCMSCHKCFGCVNLINKSYHIFNREVTPAQFDAFLEKFFNSSAHEQKQYLAKQQELIDSLPKKFGHILQGENCIGDYVRNGKNCLECFHVHDAENCKYAEHIWRNSRNNMDVSTVGRDSEWAYECINNGINSSNNSFCIQNWTCSNDIYCISCFNSHDNFGCISLKKHDHCILNTSYSVAEYETLAGKIIDHMRWTGEWGEFFPTWLSPFGYDETVASQYYPLSESEVRERWWKWKWEEETSSYHGPFVTPLATNQYDEKKVGYETAQKNIDILIGWILQCEVTGKPFKIIKQELVFYIENSIPLPTSHPDQRHKERNNLRNGQTLHERKCDNCETHIQTTYEQTARNVVCEACYLKLVH